MAQDSIAYGESLLADIRKRNEEANKRARSEAKKDAWKQLGMKVAIGVAEDVMASRHQNFLNQEEAYARQSGLNEVIERLGTTQNHEKNIKAYAGGEEAYIKKEMLMPQVQALLESQYAPGTYSKTMMASAVNDLTESYYKDFKEDFDALRDASKTYYENNDADLYRQNTAALAGSKDVDGFISEQVRKLPILSSFTGDLNKDVITANRDAYRAATVGEIDDKGKVITKGLKQFQEAFDVTGRADLASFVKEQVVKNETAAQAEGGKYLLGTQDLKYTHNVVNKKITNPRGEEVEVGYIQVVGVDSTGNVRHFAEQRMDGKGATTTNNTSLKRNYFLDIANLIKNDRIGEGSTYLLSKSSEVIDKINTRRENVLNDNGVSGMGDGPTKTWLDNKEKVLAAQIVEGGIRASEQGFGTTGLGRDLAFEMNLMDAELEDDEVMNLEVGRGNLFNTLKAYARVVEKSGGTGGAGKIKMNDFIERNSLAFYDEYLNMNTAERADLVRSLGKEGYNNFNGLLKSFNPLMEEIIEATSKKTPVQLDVVSLGNKYQLLRKTSDDSEPASASAPAPAPAPASAPVTGDRSIAALVVPPSKPNRKDSSGAKQRRQYSLILKAQKTAQATEERLNFFKTEQPAGVTLRMISDIEKRLVKEKETYNNLYDTYMKQYAPKTDDSSLLASN